MLLAVTDTAADIEAGLSTLVAEATEIGSIAASNGPVVVSTATFLADRPTLDKSSAELPSPTRPPTWQQTCGRIERGEETAITPRDVHRVGAGRGWITP